MKLYDSAFAPSPRRVRIFMAEKGLAIDKVPIDLMAREQLEPGFRTINPRCTVPALELDDGTIISEILAIWRYLEETHPEPPLMGRDAKEKAVIAMWERRMEIDGYLAAADAVRNTLPRMANRAVVGPHNYAQIPALAERSKLRIANFHRDLETRLAETPFIAGDTFSIADITAFVTLDFVAARIDLTIPPECTTLRRWHGQIAARPSASA